MFKKLLLTTLVFTISQPTLAMKVLSTEEIDALADQADEGDIKKRALEKELIFLIKAPQRFGGGNARVASVQQLLDAGASPNARDFTTHKSALQLAIETQKQSAVTFLIKRGATITGNELSTVAQMGNLELCKLMITKDNVNLPDECGWTPLYGATSMGHYNVMKFLIDNGADVNAKTNEQDTPLLQISYLAEQGNEIASKQLEKICNLLLAHGADKNIKNKDGETAYDRYPKFEFLKPDNESK